MLLGLAAATCLEESGGVASPRLAVAPRQQAPQTRGHRVGQLDRRCLLQPAPRRQRRREDLLGNGLVECHMRALVTGVGLCLATQPGSVCRWRAGKLGEQRGARLAHAGQRADIDEGPPLVHGARVLLRSLVPGCVLRGQWRAHDAALGALSRQPRRPPTGRAAQAPVRRESRRETWHRPAPGSQLGDKAARRRATSREVPRSTDRPRPARSALQVQDRCCN